MFLKLIKYVNKVGEHLELFSIRSVNRIVVICAFLDLLIECVESLKLEITPLRTSRKINEV